MRESHSDCTHPPPRWGAGRLRSPWGPCRWPGGSLVCFFNGAVHTVSEGGHESEGTAIKAVHSELRSIKAEGTANGLHAELSASTFGALGWVTCAMFNRSRSPYISLPLKVPQRYRCEKTIYRQHKGATIADQVTGRPSEKKHPHPPRWAGVRHSTPSGEEGVRERP